MVKINLVDKSFGRWTVKKAYDSYPNGASRWLCVCSCGTQKAVDGYSLRAGLSQSCGCLIGEVAKKTMTTHGKSRHPLYRVWGGMKRRCYDSGNPAFKNYGRRGIKMCREWRNDFVSFHNWAKNKWRTGLEIDRKDNDKGYYPANCRFVTRSINQKNKRKSTGQ